VTAKPVVPREQANRDVDDAVARYPYLVFYIERPDHIDVWRVLHGQRDVPAWMQEPDGSV
jgi:plasmid stabilization system protein ParE